MTDSKLIIKGIYRDFQNKNNLIFVCELLNGNIKVGKHILCKKQMIGKIISFDTIKLPFSNNTYEVTINTKNYNWKRNDVIDKEITIL
ncbi:hypothetical protein [Flammeovirga pacifica]|uniref:Uncharacterized protein n=1 Tax=Flammeovirga pacifica TaxID=915059 RepID=A0A1S1YU93_FLAPC|nr:hypothetical protein [Flammeovirga pacifica]OHX64576.1 hypothetical protein NH26_23680 [Flammeovirga pacifica]